LHLIPINLANPVLSFKIYWSVYISLPHFYFVFQHQTRDFFHIFLSVWLSLNIVTRSFNWHTFFVEMLRVHNFRINYDLGRTGWRTLWSRRYNLLSFVTCTVCTNKILTGNKELERFLSFIFQSPG
jgi:hypothetical protein